MPRELLSVFEPLPPQKPLLETPNGVPAGWAVEVSGEGVPRLVKMEESN